MQRDYRSRKAKHLAEIEERCRIAEEENVRLRQEVQMLRSTHLLQSAHQEPQAAKALEDMLQHIRAASLAASYFSQAQPTPTPMTEPGPTNELPRILAQIDYQVRPGNASQPDDIPISVEASQSEDVVMPHSPTSEASECCGGWLDCTDCLEEGLGGQPLLDRQTSYQRTTSQSNTRHS